MNNLFKFLTIVSCMTIFSRILGFIRDGIIARIFGVGLDTDAFFIAFKIPNLFRRIFAEGAFSQSFIPILVEYKNNYCQEKLKIFIAEVTGLLILILSIFSIIGILIAPYIINIITPGITTNSDFFFITLSLLRITFSYILLISLASLISSILNTWNYFSVAALVPSLLNISMISFALISSIFQPPIIALGWSVIVGGLFQLIYQLPYLKKIGMLVIPKINLYNTDIHRIIKLMGQAILGVSVSQISIFINTIFTSFLVTGSISWIYYADRLIEFPSGVIGVTLSTILLPLLSHTLLNREYSKYSLIMNWGLRISILLGLPSSVMLVILSKLLIISLFQYGKFSIIDTVMTQYSLIAYSIGLTGLIVVKVLLSGFYSRKDIKTPVRMAIITIIAIQIMNIFFINVLQLQHVGLSLSIGIGAWLNSGLLYWQIIRKRFFYLQPGWLIFLLRVILSVFIMGCILKIILFIIPFNWIELNMLYRLFFLSLIIMTGFVIYFSILLLLGVQIQKFFKI
ncbi:murein biosynthesis integral membrane protein MurJ [Candidatus Schneideria nysicola]|uniref:murein biosynthesis integral membrane protein MurJ n=1 Tax=Candidatus Schneideria nysicola TaxID=1081631 RepID=UPI001CAA5CA2|nr:murein biosynthesis integral membrane protein MurJ [Candidatus Schneideria nysicola]UAJ66309.1 murein biosynthesis integral membrane protein MurJ [Candidatus Schneideria nysicola]